MTRAGWWLAFAGLMLAALALLGGLWWQDDRQRRREAAEPLVIVTQDATLRRGNAEGYPARLDAKLPRGVEARALTRRGGWVQVRLAGGAIGWLPATATLKVDD
jgi:acyl-coenzyme A synthetase/AMP-(fatty) acid ligase